MARKGKRNGATVLIGMPWRVSAVLALLSFVGLRWVLPGMVPDQRLFAAILPTFEIMSWIPLCAFGAIALLAALRERVEAARDQAAEAAARRKRQRPGQEQVLAPPPTTWSLDALRLLEWKRVELLCAKYYEAAGFRTETLAAGPDGGIDVKLYKLDATMPLAIVQCKAWNTRAVGVKEIRELLGVMAHTRVGRGIFVTTGGYSQEAVTFGAANPIQLLDGPAFVAKLTGLPRAQQDSLLAFAFEGDYRTPTCPSCGVKLLARSGKRGAFWGCGNYPRCKTLIQVAAPVSA